MEEPMLREPIWQRLAAKAANWAAEVGALRRWALRRGDRALYEFYCVKRFEGLPVGVQEFRHRAIMNLLCSIERAIADGRISRRTRERLLRVLVGNMFANARKNVAPFIAKHGFEPPAFLAVSPTQKCNLCCSGCYASASRGTTAVLSYDVLRRMLRDKHDNWGSHFTVISGGEPLMYESQGKTLFDLFAEFSDSYFMFYTNGTLLGEREAERLAELGNATPALSVEGFERETDVRRGKGVYRRTELALDALRKAGVPFGVSFTATRQNADVLLSEDIIKHYFDEKGAVYAWMFHYMPIGRGYAVDRMITPDQRVRMLDRQLDLAQKRGLFFIDFWNGGPMSGGCICAGRPGGYFYVDWNGDISPCVFIPYAVDNIHAVYESGRTLTSVLDAPMFRCIRDWQHEYAGRNGTAPTQNLFLPCPTRDHHDVAHHAIVRYGAKPLDENAAAALADPEYHQRMNGFGRELKVLLDPVWHREISDRKQGA